MEDLEKLIKTRTELKKKIKEIKIDDLFAALLIITTPSALPNVAGCVQLFGYLGMMLFSIAFFDIGFPFVLKLFGFGVSAFFSVGFAFFYHNVYGNTDTINRMEQQLKEIETEIANFGNNPQKGQDYNSSLESKKGNDTKKTNAAFGFRHNGEPIRKDVDLEPKKRGLGR